MNATARGYHRQAAIDALADGYVLAGVDEKQAVITATRAVDRVIAYARELALGGDAAALLARIQNLRAALASIEARAERGADGRLSVTAALKAIGGAANGALKADDGAARQAEELKG